MYLTSFAPVPEPSSAIRLSIALLGVAFVIHKRQAVRNFSSAAMMRGVARDRRVAVQYVWLCEHPWSNLVMVVKRKFVIRPLGPY